MPNTYQKIHLGSEAIFNDFLGESIRRAENAKETCDIICKKIKENEEFFLGHSFATWYDDEKNKVQGDITKLPPEHFRLASEIFGYLSLERLDSLLAIVMSVFSLESFINFIGYDSSEHGIFEREVWDSIKQDRLEKKVYLLQFLLKDKLNGEKKVGIKDDLFKDLQKIIELRNYIVHYKDYRFKEMLLHPSGILVSHYYEKINPKTALFAVETVEKIMDTFIISKNEAVT